MQKILELKTQDWYKGIAYHATAALGGLFSRMTGTNPWEQIGILKASLSPDSFTPTTVPKFMTNINSSGTSYVFYHTNTKLYQVTAASPYTQTDKSSIINISTNIVGTTVWRGRYIYAQLTTGKIRSVTLPAGGDDVEVLAGFAATVPDYLPFCIGADSNLYFGYTQGIIGELVLETGTSGNTNQAIQIDFTQTIRDLVNDGRYLVIISDGNATNVASRVAGNYDCQIGFWDMQKATLDYIYHIQDAYLIGAKIIDGVIYVIGHNGIYACSAGNPPKLIRPFSDTNANLGALPSNPSQIGVHNGSIFWLNGVTNSNLGNIVSAYGAPIAGLQKIFYQPYTDTGSPSSTTKSCMAIVGETIWVADDTPKVWVHNTGSTRGTLQFSPINTSFEVPYTYGYTKVVLDSALTSGQSVGVSAISQSSTKTITNETKNYSDADVGAKQTLIFTRKPSTNYVDKFEDMFLTVTAVGASVRRVAVYATPLPDGTQNL